MQFIRTRRPQTLQSLRSLVPPPAASVRVVAQQRSPEWSELLGACALITAFLVIAMFG
jgi:hypothetical protein